MEFFEMQKRAARVRERYAEFETTRYGAAWTNEEMALGLLGDVGDLAKLVLAVNGKREIKHAREKLEHERADGLWSVMVLAQAHDIDLERAFVRTMDELQERLNANE